MKSPRGRKNLPISIVDPAPGELRIVQELVNTADLSKKTDALTDPQALASWLVSRGLLAPGTTLTQANLRQAVDLREGLRALLRANNGTALADADLARLERAAATARFQACFAPDGRGRFVPLAQTFEDALGRVVEIVISAQLTGTWSRLKGCAHGKCRGAFYDASRNRTGKWCSMRRCGNQLKSRAYRRLGPVSSRHPSRSS